MQSTPVISTSLGELKTCRHRGGRDNGGLHFRTFITIYLTKYSLHHVGNLCEGYCVIRWMKIGQIGEIIHKQVTYNILDSVLFVFLILI